MFSGDGTCRSNAPHIISRPGTCGPRGERDRVGAQNIVLPLLNVMNIPVFSCSCPHQSSIIVMLLLPIPRSICIMLMTNINCFLIIMSQKYVKDLAGGKTDREMGKNHHIYLGRSAADSDPDILIVCFLPDWPPIFPPQCLCLIRNWRRSLVGAGNRKRGNDDGPRSGN